MAAKYMLVAGSPVPEDVCRDVRRCIWAQLRPEQRDLLASLRGDDDDTWTPQQGVSYEATARRRIGKTTLQLANLLLLVFDNQGTSGKASFFCSGRRQWRNCQDILRKFLDTIKECTQLDPSKAAAELLDGGATLHLGSWEVQMRVVKDLADVDTPDDVMGNSTAATVREVLLARHLLVVIDEVLASTDQAGAELLKKIKAFIPTSGTTLFYLYTPTH